VRPELDDTALAAGADVTATAAGPARSPAPSTLASGQQLGHFRVDKPLGAGGMGEVYLATDLALDRPVAIKVLPADLARDPTRRDRMVREARAQARVTHPNVAHIYFIGEEAGRLYFAMEYVAGKTLAERIADGPLDADEALAVIRSAALGLREAHRSGFTHRDVKPSNLMTDGHGVIKVLDFGLAAGGGGVASDGPVAQTSLAGTPLYMAPEQGRGDAVDHRADIYALGATLYHLVSGAPPFQADTADKLLSLHASGDRPALPRGKHTRTQVTALDALLTKMMAPKPEDRFASYDDLLRALELTSAQHTSPGGFWARSIAAFFDLIGIALLVTIIGSLVLINTDLEVPTNLIAFALLGVYEAIAVRRWGTTAGKALLELEVVSVTTGQRPSWSASIKRAVASCGPVALIGWADEVFDLAGAHAAHAVAAIAAIATFPAMLLFLLFAALRSPGKRTVWDRWAGTMVRYRTRRTSNPV
jgi:Protein kinase domain/RDD family